METAEVHAASSLRLTKAVALLVCGAAAHAWIGSAAPTRRPPTPAAAMAQVAVHAEQPPTGTAGNAAQGLMIASTLGNGTVQHGVAPDLRTSVVERTERTSLGGAMLEMIATPLQAAVQSDRSPEGNAEIALPAVLATAELHTPPPPVFDEPEAPGTQRLSEETAPGVVEPFPERPATEVAEPSLDERRVADILQQYRLAYERLDVAAAQHIWPSVDARALGSAFRQLAGQRLTFQSCGVSVSGSGADATARCRGHAEYVPKVGSRRPYVAEAEWTFDLAKRDADWRITRASATVK